MIRRRQKEDRSSQVATETPSALAVVSEYAEALATRDSWRMNSLRSSDFVLDFVHGDALENGPLSIGETKKFWPAWFAGFPEMDYEVTRTVAAKEVVVTQWIFTGTNSGLPAAPIFENRREPTDRTIRFRGVSIYDVRDGLIQRETMYMDLATLMVELGVEL
jgi:predicted ester cyclase